MPRHARELEKVEPGRHAAAALEQHGGEAAHHGQRVGDPEEESPDEEDGKRSRVHEQEQAQHEDQRCRHEGSRKTADDQHAYRHGGGHAGEAEGARHEPELPVGKRLRAADLRQERAEGADAEGVAEKQDEEKTRPVEPGKAARARHLNDRSIHHG